MAKVDYLSFSGWRVMRECGEAYKHRYVDRVQVMDQNQVNLIKGNALHNLMEATIVEGQGEPSWMVEHAPLFWSREIAKVEANPQQTLVWGAGGEEKQRELYLVWARELARLFKAHGLTPDRVQSEFKADSWVTLGSHKIKMAGRIDMLVKGKSPDGTPRYLILDLKSSANKSIIEDKSQLTWYALLTDIFLGDQLKTPVSHAGFLLPGFPEGQRLQMFETTEEAKENLKLRIIESLDSINAKEFDPQPKGKGCWFCPFKAVHCSAYGGATEQQAGIVSLGAGRFSNPASDSLL